MEKQKWKVIFHGTVWYSLSLKDLMQYFFLQEQINPETRKIRQKASGGFSCKGVRPFLK